jgi:lantibiotic modifying enzyme
VERLPLFERILVKKLAEQRLEAVAQAIKIQIEKEPEPGFMTGLAGQAIFLYTYGRTFSSSRFENLGFLALERAMGMINNGFSWPSLAAGLAGIRFTLRYLASKGYIPESDAAALDDIGPYLNDFADERFRQGDYDLLHGALGIFFQENLPSATLTLQQPQQPQQSQLSQQPQQSPPASLSSRSITSYLRNLAVIPSTGQLAWESQHPQTGVREINLGLAHGIPSVLLALSQVTGDADATEMLSQGVDYLLSCRQNSGNGSLFPHRMVKGKPDQSGRLAWCYGDPGVGAALWQIGMNSNRPDWQADAIGILHKAASRRDTAANRVLDACICHGTSGLALLFFKMALVTGHDEFLDAASHWTRATLDHGQNDGAGAGYLFYTTGDRYRSNGSLLEGIAGVGLTLLALLDSETMGWEQGLLL